MDAQENALIAISKIPSNTGHTLHKGTPRETFIKEFLSSHLPDNISIGTGEIIDAKSNPNEQRNQHDIVIYKNNYPKLNFGGEINGYLIESVIASIEVKSTLTEKDLEQAIKSAHNSKKLQKNTIKTMSSGYIPPAISNFVIAYDGPKNISTVYKWIPKIHEKLGIKIPNLDSDVNKRIQTPSSSIDVIIILNKGFIYFDNLPIGFTTEEIRLKIPDLKWIMSDTKDGNLLFFFLLLQNSFSNMQGEWLNVIPYLKNFKVNKIQYGK